MKKIAIIDLGSNSVRMDIVEIDENREYTYIKRLRKLIKLSEGMGEDMKLQKSKMEYAAEVLREFKAEADAEGADDIIAVATAAVRKAENKEEFLKIVSDRCGLAIDVISGEREAEYVFCGVLGDKDIEDCVIIDTGGGSTELILASGGEALARVSLPFGAVSLSEQFCGYGETADALNEVRNFLRSELDKIEWLDDAEGLPVIGVGGSITTMAIVENSIYGTDREIDGYTIADDRAEEIFEEIFNMDDNSRLSAGIEEGRLDTVLCGQAPNLALMERISSPQLIISTAGLREGILYSLLG